MGYCQVLVAQPRAKGGRGCFPKSLETSGGPLFLTGQLVTGMALHKVRGPTSPRFHSIKWPLSFPSDLCCAGLGEETSGDKDKGCSG